MRRSLVAAFFFGSALVVACLSESRRADDTEGPTASTGPTDATTVLAPASDSPDRSTDLEPKDGRNTTSCADTVDAGDADSGRCNADNECGDSAPCGCSWHYCLPDSTCTADVNCVGGQRCAFSAYPGMTANTTHFVAPDGIALGYFCTTPDDACWCDTDEGCAYDVTRKRWRCVRGS